MYRLVKQRDRRNKNLVQVKCIKDKDKKMFLLVEDIQQSWIRYFDRFFNEDYENMIEFNALSTLNENRYFLFLSAY